MIIIKIMMIMTKKEIQYGESNNIDNKLFFLFKF